MDTRRHHNQRVTLFQYVNLQFSPFQESIDLVGDNDMGYYIYDSNGYVGDLASNKGLSDLAKFIEKCPDMEELNSLFTDGNILKTDHLLEELKLLGTPKDTDIRGTLNNLKTLIEKSSDIVIITQEPGE